MTNAIVKRKLKKGDRKGSRKSEKQMIEENIRVKEPPPKKKEK